MKRGGPLTVDESGYPVATGEEHEYFVPSDDPTGPFYTVDLWRQTCTCPAYTFRGRTCKHLRRFNRTLVRLHSRGGRG